MTDSSSSIVQDPRWEIVAKRLTGEFFYSVASTGVYCRPGCPARLPQPKNVRFFSTPEEAKRAGFRPCARCLPDEPDLAVRHSSAIAEACRRIEASQLPISLAELSSAAGMSPAHFHRLFRTVTGLTPKQFSDAARAKRLRNGLREGVSVTDAIYGAGFNSSGRFYAKAGEILGMSADRFRKGGAGLTIHYGIGQCSLGYVLAGKTDRGICTILLANNADELLQEIREEFPSASYVEADPAFEEQLSTVIAVLDGNRGVDELPLDVLGTAFQKLVWQALLQIPPGTTMTYSELAARLGSPRATRAVASACAANRLGCGNTVPSGCTYGWRIGWLSLGNRA
jgi:AraC family transcriptional regulator of adaptative response/methylated-DNA-[protein]-cysteine methyltransferase